jgi:hypothetical protein
MALRVRIVAIVGLLSIGCGVEAPATAKALTSQTADAVIYRDYANGAGPTAIFRLGRYESPASKLDVFGVVDPLLWRIRYFSLKDYSDERAPLADRISWIGDCFLPPSFRVWRIHRFENRIVLQSQPEIDKKSPPGKDGALVTRKLELEGGVKAAAALVNGPRPVSLDARPPTPCGRDSSLDVIFDPTKDSASGVTGGEATPFTVVNRDKDAASAFLKKPMKITGGGLWLSSIRELEPSFDGDANILARNFLVTGRSNTRPGFANSVVRLVRIKSDGSPTRSLQIKMGLARVKSGQRSVAVASTGREILFVGAGRHDDGFVIHSCNFSSPTSGKEICVLEAEGNEVVSAATPEDQGSTARLETDNQTASGKQIWSRASWFVSRTYNLDARESADKCSSWRMEKCKAGGHWWQPINELRYLNTIYHWKGVPYGQKRGASALTPKPPPGADDLGQTLPQPTPLKFQSSGATIVASDIYNDDDLIGDPSVKVFGIDCSVFVASLWGRKGDWDTGKFVAEANDRPRRRIPEFGGLGSGDALVIKLPGYLNHIVMFREQVKASPIDSSHAVLVIESSSSCGGVCWSLYDESFFHGWALIGRNERDRGPRESRGAMERIPTKFEEWKKMFGQAAK